MNYKEFVIQMIENKKRNLDIIKEELLDANSSLQTRCDNLFWYNGCGICPLADKCMAENCIWDSKALSCLNILKDNIEGFDDGDIVCKEDMKE